MNLFEPSQKNPDIARVHIDFAQELRQQIWTRLNGRISPIRRWAIHFHRLHHIDGISLSRIKKVLGWHALHWRDKFTPRIYSAETFRKKFKALEEAIRRTGAEKPKKITRQARRLSGEFLCFWPGTEKTGELEMIQGSLNAGRQFLKDLSTLKERRNHATLAEWIEDMIGGPLSLTRWWIGYVHSLAFDWKEWKGPLSSWIWTPDRPAFVRLAEGWTREYTGEKERWGQLMEELR